MRLDGRHVPLLVPLTALLLEQLLSEVPFPSHRELVREPPPTMRETANFQLVFMAFGGAVFSSLLWLMLDQVLHVVRTVDCICVEELQKAARKVTIREFLGIIMFIALLIEETGMLQGGVIAAYGSPTVYILKFAWSFGAILVGLLVRASMISRERMHIEEYIMWWRRQLAAIILLQCLCLAAIVNVLFHAPPVTWDLLAHDVDDPNLQSPCTLLNASYVDSHCRPATLAEVAVNNAHTSLLQGFVCNDGGWHQYITASSACYVFVSTRMQFNAMNSLSMVVQFAPNLLILYELRRNQPLVTCARSLGDASMAAMVASLLYCLASAMFVTWVGSTLATLITASILICAATISLFSYAAESIRRGVLRLAGYDVTQRFHCFLSHDWGTDELGRSNHHRVRKINRILKARGFSTWMDADRMSGDPVAAMTFGIDASDIVLAFVTRNYVTKVAGLGPRGQGDSCLAEFNYSLNRRGVERMIAVVMEPRCEDIGQWQGAVGFKLGNSMYIKLSADEDGQEFEEGIEKLIEELARRGVEPRRPGTPASSHAGSLRPNSGWFWSAKSGKLLAPGREGLGEGTELDGPLEAPTSPAGPEMPTRREAHVRGEGDSPA
jgi:hypothetical protein